MERTPENNSFNNSTAQNPAQNELDLEFNHMEPIMPKKAVKSEPSLFDKVAGKAKSVLTKKETNEPPQFNMRKEPTFGQPVTSQVLPEQDEFLREVEKIRKSGSAQQHQIITGSDFVPSISYREAVARSKGIPLPISTNRNMQAETVAQVSPPTVTASLTPETTNNPPSDTALTQTASQLQSIATEITSPQPQVQNTPFFASTASAPIDQQTNSELPHTVSSQPHAAEEILDVTAPLAQTQTHRDFSNIAPTLPQMQAITEVTAKSVTPPQMQTTTGFADAMSAHTKSETVTGFSDAIAQSQLQPQRTQSFSETLKTTSPEQTISGFSHDASERPTESDAAIVIEMPKNETTISPLQNCDSLTDLTDSIAAQVKEQVKTQLVDELLHHKVEATVSQIMEHNDLITISDPPQVSADSVSSSQPTISDSAVVDPLTISIEKEINTTMEQKSLQNEGFFDRTSLSNPIPEVSVKATTDPALSAEDDFVSEFRTLQTKSTHETISSDDDFLNEFEAIKAKAQTQNEEPVREKKMKNPENWSVLQKLPPKHRRLFIAILGLLLLLIAFFWLKPSSPTVEDFQAQSNSNTLPIEFQPLNQSQNIEDHDASTTQESAQQNESRQENQEEQTLSTENVASDIVATQTEETKNVAVVLLQESTALAQSTLQLPALTEAAVDTTETAENNTPPQRSKQPKSATDRIKAMEQRASGQQQTPKQQNLSRAEREKQQREAKRTAQTNNHNEDEQLAEPISSGRAKTLTVPAGVSLMQVFRDNNLNIADVNSMTKAAGGNNVLNNFKPGDKVRVVVNAQGRVNVLRLSNGATFIRQTNGTYKYHP